MNKQNVEWGKEVWLVKIIVHLLIILTCLVLTIIAPKKVFEDTMPFTLATSMAITSEENYILYDYEVYSTETRFNAGLSEDLNAVKAAFYQRNEIMAVKIHGDHYQVAVEEDYILIYTPSVPELNIEYYLVKNLVVADVSLPCRTFIMLFGDISHLINNIYLVVLLILAFSIVTTSAIKLTKSIIALRKYPPIKE